MMTKMMAMNRLNQSLMMTMKSLKQKSLKPKYSMKIRLKKYKNHRHLVPLDRIQLPLKKVQFGTRTVRRLQPYWSSFYSLVWVVGGISVTRPQSSRLPHLAMETICGLMSTMESSKLMEMRWSRYCVMRFLQVHWMTFVKNFESSFQVVARHPSEMGALQIWSIQAIPTWKEPSKRWMLMGELGMLLNRR